MGLVIPAVAYVCGRGVEAEHPQSRYNLAKSRFLADFRSDYELFCMHIREREVAEGCVGQTVMSRNYNGPETVVESDRNLRPVLRGLVEKCTILTTEFVDLCRLHKTRSFPEQEVFKTLAGSMTPIFLVPGFRCDGFINDFSEAGLFYAEALRLTDCIKRKAYMDMTDDALNNFVCEVSSYTFDVVSRARQSANRMFKTARPTSTPNRPLK